MIIPIVILTSIDLITKMLAVHYQAPHLTFNKGMGMNLQNTPAFNFIAEFTGLDLLFFMKFIFPVIVAPLMVYGVRGIPNKFCRDYAIIFFMSCFLGNYISRFDPRGVIDFIPMPFSNYIVNIADIYSATYALLLIIGAILAYREEQQKELKTL